MFDVTTFDPAVALGQLGAFVLWTFAVAGLAKLLFASFPAAELASRLADRDAPRAARLRRLQWQLGQDRLLPDEAPLPRDAQESGRYRKLSPSEFATLRAGLRGVIRASMPYRAAMYGLNCWACQAAWSSLILWAATHGLTRVGAALVSMLAYSAAATLLTSVGGCRGSSRPTEPAGFRP